jgi:hippurate hydrolase
VSIPENLYLGGIAKWMVPSVGKLLQRRIGEIANCVAEVSGATAKLAYTQFLPPVINNKACAKRVVVASRRTVPEVQVHADMPPTMASEDFSFMLNEVPGAYFFLGAGREGQKPLHHPSFDFNDDAIPLGIEIMMQLVEGE